MRSLRPFQLVTSRDERDDPEEVLVILDAGIPHPLGPCAVVAPAGFESERRYRMERLLHLWTSPEVTAMGNPHLKIPVYVESYVRGTMDGQELVEDVLTQLRHFARLHAVDFADALEVSLMHYDAEQADRG